MSEDSTNKTVRIKLGIVNAWEPLDAEWNRKCTSNSNNSSVVEIDETRIDVDIEEAEKQINALTKRTRIFTIAFLTIMTLVFAGILLDRGSVCLSK